MASVLRQLQAEWNSLVPAAQAAGIRRVRLLNAPLEPIAYRREKLEWLKAQLLGGAAQTAGWDDLTFGVELEFYLPDDVRHDALALRLTNAGIPTNFEGYNHNTRRTWKIVPDGSLGDYRRGAELVSPPLQGDEGLELLARVCRLLTENRCKVRKRCGFHVHVGVKHLPDEGVDAVKGTLMIYAQAEEAIDTVLSPSRRGSNNPFAVPVNINPMNMLAATSMQQVAAAYYQRAEATRGGARYKKVNISSYWQYGTVEFRAHQGSTDAERVTNWTRLCLRIVAKAKTGWTPDMSGPRMDLPRLLETLGCTDAERAFFTRRAAYLSRAVREAA